MKYNLCHGNTLILLSLIIKMLFKLYIVKNMIEQ